MNILQICNKVPFPPKDGGAIAIWNLANGMASKGHNVTILAMNTSKHRVETKTEEENISEKIKLHYVPVNIKISLLKLLLNYLFSKYPYNAKRFINKGFNKALEDIFQTNKFDVIQLEGLYVTPHIKTIRRYTKSVIAYRAHNLESEIWKRLATYSKNPVKKIYLKNLSKRIEHLEKNLINKYDLLIPITSRDLEHFQTMGNTKPAHVTPAGIPDEQLKHVKSNVDNKTFFYIGSLDWIPNQEGLLWFIDNVWLKINKEFPEVRFHVAGRNSPRWLSKKLVMSQIHFHGEVDSAGDFVDKYQIMIVPLFAGSGMRVKIIEAMARSKVIVTTSVGAEGIDIQNGVHGIIANNANEFYESLKKLLENNIFLTNIEGNSFALVKMKYNNNSISKDLLDFYDKYKAC
ncbi:MAG: glycosyltransferase family 4 protein [Bacteroidales bacterium]|nr:glycosyltransferase family 4 protein [Bacteroidales bacterium]